MGKFDTWSIKCKLCDWKWDTCSSVIAHNPKCNRCGSTDCIVEKKEFISIKKKGKIIADLGVDPLEEVSGELDGDVLVKTTKTDNPLVIIKKDDLRFDDGLSSEDKKEILKKIDDIKTQLIRDIIDEELDS